MITIRGCQPQSVRLSGAALAASLLFLCACAAISEPVLSKLDPRTSVTVSYIRSPLIFFRPLSGAQPDAKEYVYAGPLEVNRSGDYRYYFWLASWGTMDSGELDMQRQRFASVDIIADGTVVALDMVGDNVSAIGASEYVYRKPAGWATDLYYGITIEQLRAIADATALQLRFPSSSDTFQPWDDHVGAKAGIAEFLVRTQF